VITERSRTQGARYLALLALRHRLEPRPRRLHHLAGSRVGLALKEIEGDSGAVKAEDV